MEDRPAPRQRKAKAGTVKVKVVDAKNLPLETGTYAVALCTGKAYHEDTPHRTSAAKNIWNEEFEIEVHQPVEEFLWVRLLEVSGGAEAVSGSKQIPLARMLTQAYVDEWVPLDDAEHAELHLQITYRAPPGGTMIVSHGQGPLINDGGSRPQDVLGRPPLGGRGPRPKGRGQPL